MAEVTKRPRENQAQISHPRPSPGRRWELPPSQPAGEVRNEVASQTNNLYISGMIGRFFIYILCILFFSCGSSAGAKKTVKPRYHHSYYKKHVYFKHARVGRFHIKLFEKQGVKTVKKY